MTRKKCLKLLALLIPMAISVWLLISKPPLILRDFAPKLKNRRVHYVVTPTAYYRVTTYTLNGPQPSLVTKGMRQTLAEGWIITHGGTKTMDIPSSVSATWIQYDRPSTSERLDIDTRRSGASIKTEIRYLERIRPAALDLLLARLTRGEVRWQSNIDS